MSSLNKVCLIGNLGNDPEMRYTVDGVAITNLSIATSEKWKDKDGKKQEKTEWHRIVFYKGLAEVAGEYLKKGAMIYLEGKLRTREWEDKEGIKRFTTEITGNLLKMLDKNPIKHPVDGTALDEDEDPDIPF
ncbi:single-strand binding protein [Nitrosospira sp. Nsp5]|uniref:Single-stranded DNA-binding protein n=1 Tax=Nitrosospira multiformis TaxID=1231 RepID=A0ABY0TMW9_9PROT|nr:MULTISPECIES: single-stranded DNA-binding protein [Nitrosospira]PTR05620.1 single-strand binding protein [Nitrosospira sp. Nsp5]SDR11273.1 single-strand binding protein [Nitrosospira multiformis]